MGTKIVFTSLPFTTNDISKRSHAHPLDKRGRGIYRIVFEGARPGEHCCKTIRRDDCRAGYYVEWRTPSPTQEIPGTISNFCSQTE